MTSYVEKMVAEIGDKVANHHCNKQMAALIVERIIADTKRACCDAADMYQEEAEKCRGEILELADQVKWLRHIWAQDKAELEKCRDSKYALSGLVDRSRRQADYWRKRAKKAGG